MILFIRSNTHLNILIKIILHTSLLDPRCIVYYHDGAEMHEIKMADVPIVSTRTMDDLSLRSPADYICNTFLLQRDDPRAAFETLEDILKTESEVYVSGKYNTRKYMIVVDTYDKLSTFFASFYLTFVRDVLVILAPARDDQLQYELYTHRYIGPDDNNDPIMLDTWYINNASFAFGAPLFPDKVSNHNQYGRQLLVSCKSGDICSQDPPLGSEYNIIAVYAKNFNFTLTTISFEVEKDAFDDKLVDSLMTDADNYSDIIIGPLPLAEDVDGIQSITYLYEVSVPFPRIKYGYFMLLDVLHWHVWVLTTLVVMGIYCLVVLQRKFVPDSKFRFLTLFGYLVNQPVALNSDINRSRLLKWILTMLLFFNVLIVTAYNSRLSSVMVSPVYEKDVNTLDELARSDLNLLFFDEYYETFSEDTRVRTECSERMRLEVYQTIYKKIVSIEEFENNTEDIYDTIDELLASGEYAVARYRFITGEYNEDLDYLDLMHYYEYKPIKPELFFDYYFIMLRRNSMHTIELSRLVNTATEAGLMLFWEAEARRNDKTDSVGDQKRFQDNPVDTPSAILRLPHLKGIFALWGCGIIIGLVLFIVENCSVIGYY